MFRAAQRGVMTLLDYLPSLHHAAKPRIDRAIWPLTACVDDLGRLSVGDVPLTDIADEFRTPTYVIDETDFRRRLMHYRTTLRGAETVYAGKSLLTTTIASWAAEEGAGIDVSSGGELTTVLAAGVDPGRIIMHGNAKPLDELNDAVTAGIGRVVVDSLMEIAYLACEVRRPQRLLIRVTPDIDIHGHAAVTTGVDDQKFGFTLTGGSRRRCRETDPAATTSGSRRIALPYRFAGHRRRPVRGGDPQADCRDGRYQGRPRGGPPRAEHRWRPRRSVPQR